MCRKHPPRQAHCTPKDLYKQQNNLLTPRGEKSLPRGLEVSRFPRLCRKQQLKGLWNIKKAPCGEEKTKCYRCSAGVGRYRPALFFVWLQGAARTQRALQAQGTDSTLCITMTRCVCQSHGAPVLMGNLRHDSWGPSLSLSLFSDPLFSPLHLGFHQKRWG